MVPKHYFVVCMTPIISNKILKIKRGLVRVTLAVMKHHGGGIYFAYIFTSQSIIEGNQASSSNKAGTWRQALKQRPWGAAANGLFFWLAHPAFL